jgi:hypothetical protein
LISGEDVAALRCRRMRMSRRKRMRWWNSPDWSKLPCSAESGRTVE